MERVTAALRDIASAEHVLSAAAISDDYTHDEVLTVVPKRPVSNELGAAFDPHAILNPGTLLG